MTKKNVDLGGRVLGTLAKPKIYHGKTLEDVNPEVIKRPLLSDGAVSRVCCLRCEFVLEIHQAGAELLAQKANVELPASLEGFFFLVRGCDICSDDFHEVELKQFSDLNQDD